MDPRLAITRRRTFGLALATALLATPLGAAERAGDPLPIIFVHGNGDTAAEWMVTQWRFESNGYPRDRMFAVNLRYPTARTLDDKPEPGTSSTEMVKNQLANFVDSVREKTGADKVLFVGNSRGATIIRNFLKNAGGAKVTEKVALGGGVNHGAFNLSVLMPTSEYNGASPFLTQLNAGKDEVEPGVDFLTLRSDFFDKYAQPDARFIAGIAIPSFISYDAPELKGAKNLVLPGVDHRETALGVDAFAPIFEFLTGDEPERLRVKPEPNPRLDGLVTGVTAGLYDNLPVKGAELRIFELNPRTGERRGDGPVYSVRTGDNGRWGPFDADNDANYEFVLDVPGQPVTHIYRSPFLRGSNIVHLRPAQDVADPSIGSVVILSRPAGYFGLHDKLLIDGVRPAISTDPVPNVVSATVRLPFEQMTHVTRFEDQTIAVRNWGKGHVTIAEFND